MSVIHDPGDESPEGATPSSREATLPTSAPEITEDLAPTTPPPEAAPAPQAASEDAPLPTSFDEFDLPQTLRDAIRDVGWDRPTPVQAAAFAPISAGRDVLVQSQTGTGKTGAFCVPWLAARFEPGDAADTGVQLIALTPTRELAKQVCEELVRLARFASVVPLPIYGGTAMQPQLSALRTGVHAVVGTPGRVLDHIRRRSLDLSRVRMVVLDEADEMLSMGFLEDIHAILEACPRERQTTLFSATVPTEIERIARRYMRTPMSLRLSGDDVAAAAIKHTYYSVTSAVKTRDLLDVIAVEEPATALVFCNTREEVNLVSSVLQREGFTAEPLSSDLTQTARERVLGWMREGRLRFLVATDVASRGIDISHISHVINYSFPENAESYVHRTGRTGRAGRAGQAISLISPIELGNFYYLKLQYPTIHFTESHLPPGDELQNVRSELKLDHVSSLFPELVSPEWTLLARNLMKDPRGERVIAFMLSEAMAKRTKRPTLVDEAGNEAEQEPGRGRWERTERGGRSGGAGGRDRGRGGGYGGGDDRRREGHGSRDSHGGRDDRPRRDAPDRRPEGDAPREVTDGARPDAIAADGARAAGAPRVEGEPRQDRSDRGPRRRDREAFRERSRQEFRTDAPREDGAAAPRTDAPIEAIEPAPSLGAGLPDGEAPPGADAGEAPHAEGGEGRRRRRRRGRRDRGGEGRNDDAGQTSAAVDGQPLEAAGDDAIGTDGDDAEPTELATAAPDGAMGESADPGAQPGTHEPGRRRRRRRRRGRGPGAATPGADATPGRTAPQAAVAASTDDDDDDDDDREGDDGDDDESTGGAAGEAGDAGSRKRRRRRRRGRRRTGTEPVAAPHQVVVPPRPAGQDEIVVDIDESELQLVRDQFGEIDELDDFTLKARRRGVLDTLAEEVELEDLTASDRVEHSPAPASAAADADGDADGDDGPDDGEPEGDEASDGGTDDEARRKRKRRRRKKKKVEAEPVAPPLMVPPHKDFWEVWATHFNYRDFEDPASAEPEPEPEPEPQRRSASGEPRTQEAVTGDDTWVEVRLSLGRSHAKKAADIRDLLADRTGLTGKSVRNLTVGDRDTEFQVGRRAWGKLSRAFHGVVIDGVAVEVTLLTTEEPVAEVSVDEAPEVAAIEPDAEVAPLVDPAAAP